MSAEELKREVTSQRGNTFRPADRSEFDAPTLGEVLRKGPDGEQRLQAGATGGDARYEERLAEALVARMLELLEPVLEELTAMRSTGNLVDAATLGRELGVSRQFVYDHAGELGGLRLGSGRRSRLRFELETALRAWQRITDGSPHGQAQNPASAPKRRLASTPTLLPVRGRPVQ